MSRQTKARVEFVLVNAVEAVEAAELEEADDEAPLTEARVKELVAQSVQSHSTITLTHIPAFAINTSTSTSTSTSKGH